MLIQEAAVLILKHVYVHASFLNSVSELGPMNISAARNPLVVKHQSQIYWHRYNFLSVIYLSETRDSTKIYNNELCCE